MKTLTDESFGELSKAFHHLSESYLHREVSKDNIRKFGHDLKNLFLDYKLKDIHFKIEQNGPQDLKLIGLDDMSELAITAIGAYSQLVKMGIIDEQ